MSSSGQLTSRGHEAVENRGIEAGHVATDVAAASSRKATGKCMLAFVLVAPLVLAGCETTEGLSKQNIGTGLGAAVGAGLGAAVAGKGGRVLGATIGALVGAVLGGLIGRQLDEADQKRLAEATRNAAVTGKSQSWANPDTGVSGKVTVKSETKRPQVVKVAVRKEAFDKLPPLDLVGTTYMATAGVNVRAGPGTDYGKRGTLRRGQRVHVIGKVQGRDWYLIARNGLADGFVAASYLRPAPDGADAAVAAKPSDEARVIETKATQTCRTIVQTVTLADGQEIQDEVRVCPGPNGWEVQSI